MFHYLEGRCLHLHRLVFFIIDELRNIEPRCEERTSPLSTHSRTDTTNNQAAAECRTASDVKAATTRGTLQLDAQKLSASVVKHDRKAARLMLLHGRLCGGPGSKKVAFRGTHNNDVAFPANCDPSRDVFAWRPKLPHPLHRFPLMELYLAEEAVVLPRCDACPPCDKISSSYS
jgi:hypothetical protein